MKKYRVRNKENGSILGVFESIGEASNKVVEYIEGFKMDLDGDYPSPFDFILEVSGQSPDELITDYESARSSLKLKERECNPNNLYIRPNSIITTLQKLYRETKDGYAEALYALNELFTIAEAWNKDDEFVPDFSDCSQDKFFPWFKYDKDAAGFVCADTYNAPTAAGASIGSRLCFKTRERAEQFGKKFTDLYNKVFLQRPISNLEAKGKELGRPNFKIKGKE